MDSIATMIRRVVEAKTNNFMELLALAGLDPKEDLAGLDLSGQSLERADLSGADLSGAALIGADLREADLSGANLFRVNLREAGLSGAHFRGADLSEANLFRADIRGSNLLRTSGLLQNQINVARGDKRTQLPASLRRPMHWEDDFFKSISNLVARRSRDDSV